MDLERTADPLRERILLGATLVGVALVVWWWHGALGALFWGALLAYLLAPLVRTFEGRGLSRPLSIFIVFTLAGSLLAAALWLVVPVAAREVGDMARRLPEWSRRVDGLLQSLRTWHRGFDLPRPLDRALEASAAGAERDLTMALSRIGRGMVRVFPSLLNLIIAPAVAAYILSEAKSLREGILMVFPPSSRLHVAELLWRMDRSLTGFFRGQILTAAAVGAMAALTVTLFGLGYALVIGALAALTEIVPYVGPIIGAAPAVGLALLRSPAEALWVFLAFVAIHQLEGALLSPAFEGRGAGLKPLAVMLVLFVGGEVGGLVGLALAVPLAGAVVVGTRWAWNLFLVPEAFR